MARGSQSHLQGGTSNELKHILSNWRERLPNKWDDISVWNELIMWRNHLFQFATQSINYSNENTPHPFLEVGQQETIFCYLKLADTARKHGLPEVCISSLSHLFRFSPIRPQDQFLRLREQLKCQLTMDSHWQQQGHDILRNVNVEFYDDTQKAELLQLQAEFLDALEKPSDANATFSKALNLCDSLGKGWLAWGQHCDDQWAKTSNAVQAKYAISCYMQGLRHRSSKSRMLMARVLWLLHFDDEEKSFAQTVDKYGEFLPAWMWLVWMPQLLSSLDRPEGPEISKILMRVAKAHPQALFFHLRTFIAEHRDKAKRDQSASMTPQQTPGMTPQQREMSPPVGTGTTPASAQPSGMDLDNPTETPEVKSEPVVKAESGAEDAAEGAKTPEADTAPQGGAAVKEEGKTEDLVPLTTLQKGQQVMQVLRNCHKMLVSELEAFAEEVAQGFLLSGHSLERIMELLDVLLEECFKLPPSTMEIPAATLSLLEDVAKRLSSEIARCKNPEEVLLLREYEQELVAFIKSPAMPSAATQSLSQLTTVLAAWHKRLRVALKGHSSSLKLESLCPRLLQLRKTHICIPISPLEDREQPGGQHVVQLDRVEADVQLVRLRRGVGSFQCRLVLRGNDGKDYPFFVEPSQTTPQRLDAQRLLQLQRVLNQQLENNKDTRSRHLAFPTPAVVYVTPHVRLLQDITAPTECTSLSNLSQAYLEARGRDPLAPQLQHRAYLATNRERTGDEEAFREICSEIVPQDIVKSWLVESVPSHEALWHLRTRFASQMALLSVLNYAINGDDQTPENLWLSQGTGVVIQPVLRTSYDGDTLQHSSTVPFRLTRNLTEVMQPFGLEGPYTTALCVIARCLGAKRQQLHNYASLFLRDDLLVHRMRMNRRVAHGQGGTPGVAAEHAPMSPEVVKQQVTANAEIVMARLHHLAPQKEDKDSAVQCMDNINELIAKAQNVATLSQMHPSWQAWL